MSPELAILELTDGTHLVSQEARLLGADALTVLRALAEELQDHFDTEDGTDGTPSPNLAMRLYAQIPTELL